jgi:hypothetical protein
MRRQLWRSADHLRADGATLPVDMSDLTHQPLTDNSRIKASATACSTDLIATSLSPSNTFQSPEPRSNRRQSIAREFAPCSASCALTDFRRSQVWAQHVCDACNMIETALSQMPVALGFTESGPIGMREQ